METILAMYPQKAVSSHPIIDYTTTISNIYEIGYIRDLTCSESTGLFETGTLNDVCVRETEHVPIVTLILCVVPDVRSTKNAGFTVQEGEIIFKCLLPMTDWSFASHPN